MKQGEDVWTRAPRTVLSRKHEKVLLSRACAAGQLPQQHRIWKRRRFRRLREAKTAKPAVQQKRCLLWTRQLKTLSAAIRRRGLVTASLGTRRLGSAWRTFPTRIHGSRGKGCAYTDSLGRAGTAASRCATLAELREGLDMRPGVRRAHGWRQVAAVAATLSVPGEGAAKKKKSAEAKRSLIG